MTKRRTTRRTPANPMVQMTEMAVAAGQTIGHRSLMMAQAAGDPVAMGHPEFTRMLAEKMAVVAETGAKVATQMATAQHGWAGWFGAQAQLGFAAMTSDPVTAWQRWMQLGMTQGAEIGNRLMDDAAAITDASLSSAHRVVSANAKRLGRKKR
ncbi:hypothetical protein E9232_005241 [Inquilinus ginsengisoli]|uniref:Phasin domain-containing protein n=1 Tax=Inquilinus ginsengisoli TaxID=363840 RepID=A0ABU1JVR5_9PROT|nr:hypothetical protein [Inquilinus ginsengisoli]MDR6292701.1 hypothetical protein [Inquilinus ginsengisoli]